MWACALRARVLEGAEAALEEALGGEEDARHVRWQARSRRVQQASAGELDQDAHVGALLERQST